MMGESFRGTSRFQIIERLGAGGTGVVYRAHDRLHGIDVALKTLHQDSPYGILRLKNEFRHLAEVAHENLVNLHDLHHDAGTWFFTMELIDGVDFMDWVRPVDDRSGERHLNIRRIQDAFGQLARGVSALHAAGQLHRDIKPSNLMVDADGRVVLLDFGLVTPLGHIDVRDIRGFSGTLEYMAPEQTDGRDPLPASDWYSVGAILFQALTGVLPFRGKPLQVAIDKRRLDGPPPSSVNPEVDPILDDICEQLLRLKPNERATEDDVFDAFDCTPDESIVHNSMNSGPVTQMPRLIGRESQLGSLISAVGSVRQGQSVLFSLHGQSGMGKSALVKYFIESLRGRKDVMVLKGRCYQREALPYKAFDSVIDDLTRKLATLNADELKQIMPPHIGCLTRLFPVLLNLDIVADQASAELTSSDRRDNRGAAFEALRTLLQRLSKLRLVMIHIDDVHWGDKDSADLLCELMRLPDAPALLLLCGWHTERIQSGEFVRPLRLLISRQGEGFVGRELEVGPLEKNHARSLVRYLLEQNDCSSRFVEQIVDEAAGSPFFMESLVGHVARQESEAKQEKIIRTGALTLNAVVSSRIALMERDALRLLQVVCVAGQPLPRATAVAVAALGNQGDRIISLLRAEHLIKVRTPGHQELFEVYHDRIRDVVLANLPDELAHLLHHEIALHIETTDQDNPEVLVDHFLDAGDYDRALQYATQSAERANEKLAFDRAALLYDQALDLHRESVTVPASIDALDAERELLSSLATALANSGRARQASKVYLSAAQGAPQLERQRLILRAGELLLAAGDIDHGLSVLQPLLSELSLEVSPSAEIALKRAISERSKLDARGQLFVARAPDALDSGDALRIDVCWALALGLSIFESIQGGEFQTRALRLSLQAGDEFRICRSWSMEAIFQASRGPIGAEMAGHLSDRANQIAAKNDDIYGLGISAFGSGVAAFLLGEWDESVHLLERAGRIFRENCQPMMWERVNTQLFHLSAMAFYGEYKILGQRVPELLDLARENQLHTLGEQTTMGYAQLGWLAMARTDYLAPWPDWTSGTATPQAMKLRDYLVFVAHIQTALYRRRYGDAEKLLDEAWIHFDGSLLSSIDFIRRDAASIRLRTRIAQLVSGTDHQAVLDDISADLITLRSEGLSWSCALADFFEVYVDAVKAPNTMSPEIVHKLCRSLETVGLGGYLAVAQMRFGQAIGDENGAELVSKGTRFMLEQGIREPEAFSRVFAPN